jgi:hypothetical protein
MSEGQAFIKDDDDDRDDCDDKDKDDAAAAAADDEMRPKCSSVAHTVLYYT